MLATLDLPPLPEATIVGFVGNGARKLVERALAASGGDAAVAMIDRALTDWLDYYGAHLLDRTRLHDGVEDTIRQLRARDAVLSVATNKPEAMARAILDGLGLGAAFVGVLGGDSVPRHKPDPAIIHELRRGSDVGAHETVLVGDSPVDVATARAAGIAACAVTWGLTSTEVLRAASPDLVVERPEELLRVAA